jgi:colicin import membrane protein
VKAGTRFKTGVTISAVGHVAVLAWGLINFAVKPHDREPVEALSIDVISPSDFSKMTAGMRNAKPAEAPKPLVEKVGEQKLPDNEATKVVDTFEVKASAEDPPPPKPPEPQKKPEPKKPEPPKEAKVEPKPEPRPEPKVDQIAEALKKEEPKKKPDPPKPEAAKQEAKQQPKKEQPKKEREFSQSFIQQRLAMVDKREPQRLAATGETLNQTASLGTARGTAPRMSMTWVAALKARMAQCWDVPAVYAQQDITIVVLIDLKKDGSLARNPSIADNGGQPVLAESALRAVHKCVPFTFLPPEQYQGSDGWNSLLFDFNPKSMIYG